MKHDAREAGELDVPRLHVVTDDGVLARGDLLDAASAILGAGGPHVALHVRGPRASGARLYEITRVLAPTAGSAGALLLVNDRVDVALAAGADGTHLGRRSLGVAEARRILGAGGWVGVSAHGPEEAAAAARDGADFVFVGTVFETPTHPGRKGGGADVVRAAVRAVRAVPLLAIGGVSPVRVDEVLDAGAHGVAVIRGVWEAGDPAEAARRYLEVLERATARAGAEDIDAKDR